MGTAARYFIFKLPSLLSTRLHNRHNIIGVQRLFAEYKVMDKQNTKREEMDNTNDSTSPKSSEHKLMGAIINMKTQDFHEIRNLPTFVDHTHFIDVFLNIPRLAIFAPRRFGKSSHLDMVHKFLQIDVDEKTGCAFLNEKVEERKNYKIFKGTCIMSDNSYKHLVDKHFGKHPVIRLDFIGGGINSVDSAKMHCRTVVHEAYLQHSYLGNSKKLVRGSEERNAEAQSICKKWCDDELYQKQGEQDLYGSLKNLTEFLYNHFDGAKVYILVDEIDAMITSALFRVPNDNKKVEKLEKICDVLGKLLGPVTKGCDTLVAGTLFTGVSYMAVLGISQHFNNVIHMRFLDNHSLVIKNDINVVPFYGATTEEVENLIQKLVKNKELSSFQNQKEFFNNSNELDPKKIMDVVQSHYNGYFNRNGERIFCLWSVLEYLQSGEAENYWNFTEHLGDLYMLLDIPDVLYNIIKLMRSETIRFNRTEKFYPHKLVHLFHLLAAIEDNVDLKKINTDIVFNFLIDQGYLAYSEGGASGKGEAQFQLPNAEIREALLDMIGGIVKKYFKYSTTSCTVLINGISWSLVRDEKKLQEKMLDFYEDLSLMMNSPKRVNPKHTKECLIASIMYKMLGQTASFELCVDLPIKNESGEIITLQRPDFLMYHKTDQQFAILWEIKYADDSKNEKKTSLYALQEARGIEKTQSEKKKEYMTALQQRNRQALVIGLSINSEMKVSLSYAFGMEEKIYFMSETEATSFPELYEKYKNNLVHLKKNDENDN